MSRIPSTMNKVLNDSNIRRSLIQKLIRQANPPKAVIEELHVHNGHAIADVVTLHREAHCYEIKGETDKINRITVQGSYYDLSFRRITLVTTKNHLSKAIKLAPPHWGIMQAFHDEDKVLFKHHRAAKNNPLFDKEIAALTLWKSEMLSIIDGKVNKRDPRSRLANMISLQKKKAQLSSQISDALLNRHQLTNA